MENFCSRYSLFNSYFFLLYTLIVLRQSAASAAFNAIMLLMVLMVIQHPFRAFLAKEKLQKKFIKWFCRYSSRYDKWC
jgi:TRAP-type uncharacterized transport system fused permease subunit